MFPHLRDRAYLVLARHWEPVTQGLTRLYQNADWAEIAIDGPFFIEIPDSGESYFCGVSPLTDTGWIFAEFDARLIVPDEGGVVYIGHLRMQRHQPRELVVYDFIEEQRRAAEERGLHRLLNLPWTTALAVPIGPR